MYPLEQSCPPKGDSFMIYFVNYTVRLCLFSHVYSTLFDVNHFWQRQFCSVSSLLFNSVKRTWTQQILWVHAQCKCKKQLLKGWRSQKFSPPLLHWSSCKWNCCVLSHSVFCLSTSSLSPARLLRATLVSSHDQGYREQPSYSTAWGEGVEWGSYWVQALLWWPDSTESATNTERQRVFR